MTKTFTIDGVEYTVTPCTANASCDLDASKHTILPFPQEALLVENTADSGEKIQKVVFGYEMPETAEDFEAMSEDSSAWECDHAVLETVWTAPDTNRRIVQEGLDARSAAREEATQEAQDDLFLDELNKLTQDSRDMTARLEAAQERVRAQKREQLREQQQATRRDTFMQRLFVTVAIIAAVILLYTIQAVAFWLTLTIGIAGLIYIIAISVGYWRKPRRKADNHG